MATVTPPPPTYDAVKLTPNDWGCELPNRTRGWSEGWKGGRLTFYSDLDRLRTKPVDLER